MLGAMTLPDGFRWIQAHQYEKGEPTALALEDVWVARMMDRVDGSWFVRLECQKPFDAPLVTRSCTSFEQGRSGAEEWVRRHEARLRAEVAAKLAARRKGKS